MERRVGGGEEERGQEEKREGGDERRGGEGRRGEERRLWKRACCTVKIGIFGACFYYDAVQL